MKKFLIFIAIFISIFSFTAFSFSINVNADSSDFPELQNISGWYTFTNTNSLDISSLYWDYGWDHNNSFYPVTDIDSYIIDLTFTLDGIVINDIQTDSFGNPYAYTTAKKMVIEKEFEFSGGLSYIFTNPGVNVDEQYEPVYTTEFGWVNDSYKRILISGQNVPTDFINFLEDNGIFRYINTDSNSSTVTDLIITYVDIPTMIMHGMLDINVMGTTLFAIIVGIITIVFVVYLFKRIL